MTSKISLWEMHLRMSVLLVFCTARTAGVLYTARTAGVLMWTATSTHNVGNRHWETSHSLCTAKPPGQPGAQITDPSTYRGRVIRRSTGGSGPGRQYASMQHWGNDHSCDTKSTIFVMMRASARTGPESWFKMAKSRRFRGQRGCRFGAPPLSSFGLLQSGNKEIPRHSFSLSSLQPSIPLNLYVL